MTQAPTPYSVAQSLTDLYKDVLPQKQWLHHKLRLLTQEWGQPTTKTNPQELSNLAEQRAAEYTRIYHRIPTDLDALFPVFDQTLAQLRSMIGQDKKKWEGVTALERLRQKIVDFQKQVTTDLVLMKQATESVAEQSNNSAWKRWVPAVVQSGLRGLNYYAGRAAYFKDYADIATACWKIELSNPFIMPDAMKLAMDIDSAYQTSIQIAREEGSRALELFCEPPLGPPPAALEPAVPVAAPPPSPVQMPEPVAAGAAPPEPIEVQPAALDAPPATSAAGPLTYAATAAIPQSAQRTPPPKARPFQAVRRLWQRATSKPQGNNRRD
jgi:hypothetical protein